MPNIDWVNVAIWVGIAVFTLTIWGLAVVGAASLLGLR